MVGHVPGDDELGQITALFDDYRASLPDYRQHLLDRYQLVDAARKVVGVGSVGTRCWIALLDGGGDDDPLILQIKEADASVLEAHLQPSAYPNHGHRVVEGQRFMQAASDMFLGWSSDPAGGTHYYWRQLRDMKVSADINAQPLSTFLAYAELCGMTLARAHARSGDAAAISGYLGKGKTFAARPRSLRHHLRRPERPRPRRTPTSDQGRPHTSRTRRLTHGGSRFSSARRVQVREVEARFRSLVRDILVWSKAPFLLRNELVPVDRVGEAPAGTGREATR